MKPTEGGVIFFIYVRGINVLHCIIHKKDKKVLVSSLLCHGVLVTLATFEYKKLGFYLM